MNILYIADPNSIHDIRWINFFARKNINCYVISRTIHFKKFRFEKRLLQNEVIVLDIALADPSTIRPWRNWIEARKLKKVIKNHRIDILHILYAEPNALWAIWRFYLKTPVVISTRGTDILKTIPQFFERKTLLNRLIAMQYVQSFRNADYITSTSLQQMCILEYYTSLSNIELIRTGVDIRMIETIADGIAELYGIERPFLLMPRMMKPLYNHEFTLEAIDLLDEAERDRYTFAFLNSDTEDQSYFKYIVSLASKVRADIKFLPSLPHMHLIALYKSASLVIMNPLSDGSPVTAMEAMACEVPVILPPLKYDKEVFSDVFFFRDWTALSLKNEIEKVLNLDAESKEKVIKSNRDKIEQFGNTENEMSRLEEVYRSLMS